jgi:hypothetical protein
LFNLSLDREKEMGRQSAKEVVLEIGNNYVHVLLAAVMIV